MPGDHSCARAFVWESLTWCALKGDEKMKRARKRGRDSGLETEQKRKNSGKASKARVKVTVWV